MMQLHQFLNSKALNDHLASALYLILNEAIKQRGHAYLVVSGGRTPQDLFLALSHLELPWEKVTITLTDERQVPPHVKESNEATVRTYLLQNKAIKAHFIRLYRPETKDLSELNDKISSLPIFDAVLLGMGEDGHTASLFPCSAEIKDGLSDEKTSVIEVRPQTAPYQRISLTKTRLLHSRAVFLHLLGENKLRVLNQALSDSDAISMPVRAFLHHPTVNVQIMFAPS